MDVDSPAGQDGREGEEGSGELHCDGSWRCGVQLANEGGSWNVVEVV